MKKQEKEVQDLMILGGGPAGLTASIYAGRDGLDPITINGPQTGGQIIEIINIIENFPGFPEGIKGIDLAKKFIAQAKNYGADLRFEEAIEINLEVSPFILSTYLSEYRARSLIIATGARRPRSLGLNKEGMLIGNGVSYCAICDGAMHKGDVIAVVGGSDKALEEADYLTQFACKVYLIHNRDEFEADEKTVKLIEKNDSIEIILKTEVIDLLTDYNNLSGLRIKNKDSGKQSVLEDVDGIFISLGYEPNTGFICTQLECDEHGYIITDERQHTSVKGVFAAGDVQDRNFQQIVTAVASGAKAAIEANRYLRRLDMYS